MSVEQIKNELDLLEKKIAPLIALRDSLTSNLRREQSRKFCIDERITLADVELPDGDGKPWFGTIRYFAQWLKNQPTQKRFAAWNDRVYRTSDILSGRMIETQVFVQDLY